MESIQHGCEDKQFQRICCSKEHQHTSKQKWFHGSHQQRQAEVLPEENPGFCSNEGRVKHFYDPYKHLLHRMTTTEKLSSDMVLPSRVPLYLLIANILPHIDKALELQAHYTKMKGNGISMKDFIRFTRQIVGRQLLQLALSKIQSQANKVEEDNRQTSAKDFYQNVTQEDTRQSWQSMAEHAQQRREGRLRVEIEMTQDNWLTKAANLAVRAAVGGDDMLLKWQLMAEHALQTREEKLYENAHAAKGASQAFSSTSSKLSQENWLPENRYSFSTYTAPNFSGSCPGCYCRFGAKSSNV